MTTPRTAAGQTLMDSPHVVEFTRTGYGLQHPISCRPNLLACPMNRWLAAQDNPAAKPGRYLMASPGIFTRLPKDWADPLVPSVIPTIEAEAVALALAALRVEVEGLPGLTVTEYYIEPLWIARAAALAAIDRAAKP